MKLKIATLILLAALSTSCQKVETTAHAEIKSPVAVCTTDADCDAQDKAVYYCAGKTKAGTACKHRVKTAGDYCWQHKNQDRRKK